MRKPRIFGLFLFFAPKWSHQLIHKSKKISEIDIQKQNKTVNIKNKKYLQISKIS